MVERLSYKHARAHAVSFVYGRRSRGLDGRRSRGIDGRRSRGIDGRRCMHRLAQHSKYCPQTGGGGGGGGGSGSVLPCRPPCIAQSSKQASVAFHNRNELLL